MEKKQDKKHEGKHKIPASQNMRTEMNRVSLCVFRPIELNVSPVKAMHRSV